MHLLASTSVLILHSDAIVCLQPRGFASRITGFVLKRQPIEPIA